MRNNTEKFIKAVQDYLKAAFMERVADINERDKDIHLQDIALWQSGFNGITAGLTAYPGCLILVNKRTLQDAYTTVFSLVIGIGLSADDPDYLERIGRYWEDILEDSIRSDWHLGGAALDTAEGVKFESDCTSNVYVIQAELSCDVDLQGFVYLDEPEEPETVPEEGEGDEGEGEMVQVS